MKTVFLSVALLWISGNQSVFAQDGVAINETGDNPHPSAILDVASTNKGFMPPRMTSGERDAIASPATGLVIYNTTTGCLNFYNGTEWRQSCGQ
jgi:hypothetical protein